MMYVNRQETADTVSCLHQTFSAPRHISDMVCCSVQELKHNEPSGLIFCFQGENRYFYSGVNIVY